MASDNSDYSISQQQMMGDAPTNPPPAIGSEWDAHLGKNMGIFFSPLLSHFFSSINTSLQNTILKMVCRNGI